MSYSCRHYRNRAGEWLPGGGGKNITLGYNGSGHRHR
jgi:hypothetical protein